MEEIKELLTSIGKWWVLISLSCHGMIYGIAKWIDDEINEGRAAANARNKQIIEEVKQRNHGK